MAELKAASWVLKKADYLVSTTAVY